MPEESQSRLILDTSSLIALDKLYLINILKDLYHSVNVPQAVLIEFGKLLPPWINVLTIDDYSITRLLSEKLGDGECEVITLGIENKNCLLVLDDLKARQIAQKLELKITGILGILVKAKRAEKIKEIKPLLERLEGFSFRISKELKNEVLKIADEK